MVRQAYPDRNRPPYLVTGHEQEYAFLNAIAAEPHVSDHRLVFADWLEENANIEEPLTSVVIEFHRDWVRLHRFPAPRTERNSRDRWLWYRHSRHIEGVGFAAGDLLRPDLFDNLAAGALWSGNRGVRRAYTTPQKAEEDLRLAYLRRAGLLAMQKSGES